MTLEPNTIQNLLYFFGGVVVTALVGMNEVRTARAQAKNIAVAALNYQTVMRKLVDQADNLIQEQDGLIREQIGTIADLKKEAEKHQRK